jgi:NAD(P)-dependent dehydrogenase (short-subunit alcohol dehydrogenase family)
MQNLEIAVVTGGSRGLGADMAIRLAQQGKAVVITYVAHEEKANEVLNAITKEGGKALALRLDVGVVSSFDAFKTELLSAINTAWGSSQIHYLINNAGMGATVPFATVSEQLFDDMMNVHFKGVYFLSQSLLSIMADGGGIVNISTGTTRFAFPGYSAYASMKAAVENLTRYMAKELGSRQIRANVVAPGAIETDFNNATIRNNPNVKAMIASNTALGRTGLADDVGGVVAFLCSADAKWVNGQRIEVSGGQFL